MKQKIVIYVPMPCDKSKSKAMKIAVTFCGVSSVSLGKEGDRLEIVGEGIDAVCLARCLRKKFCFADIITIEEVKPPKPEEKKPEPCKLPPCLPLPCTLPPCPPLPCYYPQPCPMQYYGCDSDPSCSIM